MSIENNNGSFGTFVPEITYTFLPGCKACGGSHPLARKPVCDPEVCPDCGAAVAAPGETQRQEAVFTGLAGKTASALFKVSEFLQKFAKGK